MAFSKFLTSSGFFTTISQLVHLYMFQIRELPDNFVVYGGDLIRERGVYRLDLFQTSEITFEPTFLPPCQAEKIFSAMKGLSFENIHAKRSVIWFGPTDYAYGSAKLVRHPIQSNKYILIKFAENLSSISGINSIAAW